MEEPAPWYLGVIAKSPMNATLQFSLIGSIGSWSGKFLRSIMLSAAALLARA